MSPGDPSHGHPSGVPPVPSQCHQFVPVPLCTLRSNVPWVCPRVPRVPPPALCPCPFWALGVPTLARGHLGCCHPKMVTTLDLGHPKIWGHPELSPQAQGVAAVGWRDPVPYEAPGDTLGTLLEPPWGHSQGHLGDTPKATLGTPQGRSWGHLGDTPGATLGTFPGPPRGHLGDIPRATSRTFPVLQSLCS